MKISIFGNEFQHESLEQVKLLLSLLHDTGAELWGDPSYVHFLNHEVGEVPYLNVFGKGAAVRADVAISIGGDGTFLRTAQAVAVQGVPIMGINAGHLGFLTSAPSAGLNLIFKEIAEGRLTTEARSMIEVTGDYAEQPDYDIEERSMLQLMLPSGYEEAKRFALNEVAILRQDTSSTIKLDVSLDDVALTTFNGDGMLLCTPTGSTAYNLSVGGPILHPQSRCFVLSPISPHALTMRPVVFADTSMLRVTVRSRARLFQVSVDGETIDLPSGTTLRIAKAPFPTRVIMLKGHRFARVLRTKLMWGKDNRGEE